MKLFFVKWMFFFYYLTHFCVIGSWTLLLQAFFWYCNWTCINYYRLAVGNWHFKNAISRDRELSQYIKALTHRVEGWIFFLIPHIKERRMWVPACNSRGKNPEESYLAILAESLSSGFSLSLWLSDQGGDKWRKRSNINLWPWPTFGHRWKWSCTYVYLYPWKLQTHIYHTHIHRRKKKVKSR